MESLYRDAALATESSTAGSITRSVSVVCVSSSSPGTAAVCALYKAVVAQHVKSAEPAGKAILEARPVSTNRLELTDDARLRRLRAVVRLLDTVIEIPGTGWRIGLDAIVGLVPGLGDLVTTAMSAWIVREARLLGVSRSARIRMGWNIAIDFLVGAVPVAGDFFDAAWKANVKNLEIIERDLAHNRIRGEPSPLDTSVASSPLRRPSAGAWPLEAGARAPSRPAFQGDPVKPKVATAAIVAIIAAIWSFFSGAFWGLILAIIAVVAGAIGMLIAVSPRRRGGLLSIGAIALGVIALVRAVFVALF
jgi:Domain of unknown function (DUF4112)